GCVGAACQYSGTVGGTALCQVAVTLTWAAPGGHALIGRALYLPESWAGDEVYGGLDLRRGIRERGVGYVLAVRSNYRVNLPSGRRVTVKTAAGLVKPSMWQRMRTGSATKGARDYHWAMIEITPDDTPEG